MKNIKSLVLLLALLGCFAWNLFATPARCRDGVIEFAIATVDGQAVYTAAEQNQAVANASAYGRVAVVSSVVSPNNSEITLSTASRYTDFSSYQTAITTTTGLEVLINQVGRDLVVAERVGDNRMAAILQSKLDTLIAEKSRR